MKVKDQNHSLLNFTFYFVLKVDLQDGDSYSTYLL